MSELPKGWLETTLGTLCSRPQYGWTTPSSESGVVKYLRTTDISGGEINWATVPYCQSPPTDLDRYQVNQGDILISRAGSVGLSYLVINAPCNAVFASYLIRFNPLPGIEPAFVSCFLKTRRYWQAISGSTAGIAIPNVNATKLGELSMPLAPLAEQRRIVAKLDELLPRVRRSQERLQNVRKTLKRFRQAVLAAACSGRLTADWRTKHDPVFASDLLSRIYEQRLASCRTPVLRQKMQALFSQVEELDESLLPNGWRFVQLAKLAHSFDYGTAAKSETTGKVAVLRMGNIQGGRIDWRDLVYSSDRREIDSYLLKPGTVLFNRTNSPELVGKTAIYRGERPAIFAGYLIRINNVLELNSEYLNICLNSPAAREFCSRVKTDGVSQSNINAQKLGTFEIPFCDPAEQEEIVRRVDALFAFADRLESRLDKATAQVDQLTQSILAKAFRGELVPTEAELAAAEGRTFESAAELLARITATNGSAAPVKRRATRRAT